MRKTRLISLGFVRLGFVSAFPHHLGQASKVEFRREWHCGLPADVLSSHAIQFHATHREAKVPLKTAKLLRENLILFLPRVILVT